MHNTFFKAFKSTIQKCCPSVSLGRIVISWVRHGLHVSQHLCLLLVANVQRTLPQRSQYDKVNYIVLRQTFCSSSQTIPSHLELAQSAERQQEKRPQNPWHSKPLPTPLPNQCWGQTGLYHNSICYSAWVTNPPAVQCLELLPFFIGL